MAPTQLIKTIFLMMSLTLASSLELEEPHDNFKEGWYTNATKIMTALYKEMTAAQTEEFGNFMANLKSLWQNTTSDVLGKRIDNFETFGDEMKNSSYTDLQMDQLKRTLQGYQLAYVKMVINVFNLEPEDFGMTPDGFCQVLQICHPKVNSCLS